MSKKELPCEVVQDLLELYMDGAVTDTTKRLVSEHMEQCEECKQSYEQFKKGNELAEKLAPANDSVHKFGVFQKKLNEQKIRRSVGIILLSVVITVALIYVALNVPLIPTGDIYAQIDSTYVVSTEATNYVVLIKKEGMRYASKTSAKPQLYYEEDGTAVFKFNEKRPLIARSMDFGKGIMIDYYSIEEIPDSISFHDKIIWTKADADKTPVPEYITEMLTKDYTGLAIDDENHLTLEFKDGTKKTWDVGKNLTGITTE